VFFKTLENSSGFLCGFFQSLKKEQTSGVPNVPLVFSKETK